MWIFLRGCMWKRAVISLWTLLQWQTILWQRNCYFTLNPPSSTREQFHAAWCEAARADVRWEKPQCLGLDCCFPDSENLGSESSLTLCSRVIHLQGGVVSSGWGFLFLFFFFSPFFRLGWSRSLQTPEFVSAVLVQKTGKYFWLLWNEKTSCKINMLFPPCFLKEQHPKRDRAVTDFHWRKQSPSSEKCTFQYCPSSYAPDGHGQERPPHNPWHDGHCLDCDDAHAFHQNGDAAPRLCSGHPSERLPPRAPRAGGGVRQEPHSWPVQFQHPATELPEANAGLYLFRDLQGRRARGTERSSVCVLIYL